MQDGCEYRIFEIGRDDYAKNVVIGNPDFMSEEPEKCDRYLKDGEMSIYSKIIDQQKLMAAWKKVVGNKPACGVDHVTWDEFEKNSRMEIRRLNAELKNHIYTVQPVKLVTLVKDDKMREISLYTMRDKVIQTSIAAELERWFEAGFSRCAYAYRSDRSAMMAVEAIERYIVSHTESWVGRLDIDSFFDSIPQNILMGKLSAVIREQDVLELVREQLRAPSFGSSGELVDKSVGLYQGSSLSPVLSNIYMTEFDRAMEKTSVFYIRYSDDILILGDSREEIHRMMEKMKKMLEELDYGPRRAKHTAVVWRREWISLAIILTIRGKRYREKQGKS